MEATPVLYESTLESAANYVASLTLVQVKKGIIHSLLIWEVVSFIQNVDLSIFLTVPKVIKAVKIKVFWDIIGTFRNQVVLV